MAEEEVMNVETKTVELSLLVQTVTMLEAFTKARNGSINNQADSALRTGVEALVLSAPRAFRDEYERILAAEIAKAEGLVDG
jgi:hypothetical protein